MSVQTPSIRRFRVDDEGSVSVWVALIVVAGVGLVAIVLGLTSPIWGDIVQQGIGRLTSPWASPFWRFGTRRR